MGFRFFYTPKPRRFHMKTRYYDEAKEEREHRQKRVDQEMGKTDKKDYVPHVKGQFRRQFGEAPRTMGQQERRKSNIRLLIIILVLLAVAYLLYVSSGF